MRTERIADTDLRFRRNGAGEAALVFVHGFLDDQYAWDGVIAELGRADVETVQLDLAGMGERTDAGGPFTYDRFAAEAGAVADALDKPVIFVAQSMAGPIVELAAAARPERTLGLVLVDPVPLAGTRLPEEVIESFRSLGGDLPAQRSLRQQLGPSLGQADLDRLTVIGGRIRPDVVRDLADCWNNGHPDGEKPSRYPGPVLVIRGAEDPVVTDDLLSTAVLPRFPQVESATVQGAGRAAMGLPPLTWSYMRRYITAYRGLLRGEVVEWDGARMRMLPAEQDPQTPPAPPPILISALGPKGAEVTRAIGADGLFSFGAPSAAMSQFGWAVLGTGGTVLDDGESPDSPRVRAAAGPMWALTYHYPYTVAGGDGVRDVPGGPEWLAVIEKTPEPDRHLAVHTGHLVRLNEADTAAWEAGGSALVTAASLTGPAADIRQAMSALAEQGVTEIAYLPCGPDIRRELEAFIEAARHVADRAGSSHD